MARYGDSLSSRQLLKAIWGQILGTTRRRHVKFHEGLKTKYQEMQKRELQSFR